MIEIKIQCACGQRYKFDVEPINNRMPFTVNCPICGLDGTEKANSILQQSPAGHTGHSNDKRMQVKQKAVPPQGMTVADIYHILFRHKWKILAIWATGAVAATTVFLSWPLPYQSTAKILVRYVQDNQSPIAMGTEATIMHTEAGGAGVINSEIEILSSFDLAKQVATVIGPDRILGKTGGGTNVLRAAALIRNNLKIDPPNSGSVIHIIFQHPDSDLVQPVLTQLIDSYEEMHSEVRGSVNTEYLTAQVADLRGQVLQTEKDLQEQKNKIGVISMDDAKRAYTERKERYQEELAKAEAELLEHQTILSSMTNLVDDTEATNLLSQTKPPPPDVVSKYKDARDKVEFYKAQLRPLYYLPASNEQVVLLQGLIAKQEETKTNLEAMYPLLTGYQSATAGLMPQGPTPMDLMNERARVNAVATRVNYWKDRQQKLDTEIDQLNAAESVINNLQRTRDQQDATLKGLLASLERAHLTEKLGSDRSSNIKCIQTPSPPSRDPAKIMKAVLALLAGSFAGGLGLAFLIELQLDRSFRRPVEVENSLHVPLFLCIPHTNGHSHHSLAARGLRLLPWHSSNGENGTANKTGHVEDEAIAPWKPTHRLRPYFEALRDRLITYFEVKNMTHKPKLVAVTSCGEGSGVTTIASGLASSLSETGDGNVLLVDMNGQGAAHYFCHGKLECGLDDALEMEKRSSAMVKDNLYVVSESSDEDNLPRVLHKRFSGLMPKLKASDYDYIIFDMPPVSQISPTARLARFMDMVFMVVEAEETDRDVVKRASALLEETKTNVGVVLNKARVYVPKRIHQEF